MEKIDLSAGEARRLLLYGQGLIGASARRGGVARVLGRVGAVQLDTISVLARSHELVAYARLGAVGRDAVEQAYWPSGKPRAFEYWAHAACVLPIEEWPYYAFRRRAFVAQGQRWHKVSESACADVLARLAAEGPLTATQLGGAKGGGPWWDWSEVKVAAEWLLDTGRVICARRTGWRRVYDLPERVLPRDLLDGGPSDGGPSDGGPSYGECVAHLVATAGRALGVATRADLMDYNRFKAGTLLEAGIEAAGLVPVTIGGGTTPAWADPEALAWLGKGSGEVGGGRGHHRVTLLSPFDSVVWDRKRTARTFGFTHIFEAYVPQAKRVNGYYSMPLLAGGELVGQVDPGREGRTLVAKHAMLERSSAVEPMARALREAAEWVGCDSLAVRRVTPETLTGPLSAALRAV
jgi:uncharacterized protein YcaQ